MNMQAQHVGQFDHAMKAQQAGGAIAKSPSIIDQIGRAHEQLDRLTGAIGCLDERLMPILSFSQPSPISAGMNAVAIEPPAIEELNRLLLRIQGLVSRVDDITERARV
jgi:hypothetical protein